MKQVCAARAKKCILARSKHVRSREQKKAGGSEGGLGGEVLGGERWYINDCGEGGVAYWYTIIWSNGMSIFRPFWPESLLSNIQLKVALRNYLSWSMFRAYPLYSKVNFLRPWWHCQFLWKFSKHGTPHKRCHIYHLLQAVWRANPQITTQAKEQRRKLVEG